MMVPASATKRDLAALDALLAQVAGLPQPVTVYRHLTFSERQILEALRRAAPDELPVATLYLAITDRNGWPHRSADPAHLVDAHTCRLRSKLAALGTGLRLDVIRGRARSGGMRALRLCPVDAP